MRSLTLILFAISLFFVCNVYGQGYKVQVYVNDVSGCFEPFLGLDVTMDGQSQNGVATYNSTFPVKVFEYTFPSMPSSTITFDGSYFCNKACLTCDPPCRDSEVINSTVQLGIDYACVSQFYDPFTNCGFYAEIEVVWTPIYSNPTRSGKDLCEGDDLTLTSTSGYSNYVWEYKDASSSVFKSFNTSPGTGNSVTFGIDQIYGPSYQDKLGSNNGIWFQVALGSCPPVLTDSLVHFFPQAPQVLAENVGFTKTEPQCNGGTGSVTITQLNRSILSDEILTIGVFTQSADVFEPNGVGLIDQRTGVTGLPLTFSNLPSGDYKFFIQSNPYQCGDINNPLVTNFSITEPTAVTFSATPTEPLCYGGSNGSIAVTASGGSGTGYQYSKDGGSNYQGAATFTGLTSNSYNIKIKDSKSCESSVTPVTVTQPSDINISSSAVTSSYNGRDISCVGSTNGQITTAASGGTGSLTYSKDGTTYQASNIINSLGAGSYTIYVKDNNGCIKQNGPVNIVAPPAITASLTPTATTCNGTADGQIVVNSPAGGTGTLSYSKDGTTYQGTTTFAGLAANAYTITIKDANLCTNTFNTTVTQPAAIGITSTPTLVTCSGGSDGTVTITASNTQGAVQYSLDGGSLQSSNVFNNLTASSHSILVQDGQGCTGTGNVTVNSNPVITGPITATAVSCNGGNNGALNLTPGGGVGPYTYLWSTTATTEDISNLTANNYSVTITDSKNCQKTFNQTVTQPLPISMSALLSDYNGVNISCNGGSNGTITITTTGGNGGYTYNWSNSSTNKDQTNLTAGTYTVTATDNKSCTGNKNITLIEPQPLNTTISNVQNVLCYGGNSGSITLTTTGGTTTYEYSKDNGANWQSSNSFTGLTVNTYTIKTRDINGCTDSDNTAITSPADLILTVDNIDNPTCNQNNGGASTSATGGVSTYNFTWYDNTNAQIGSSNVITNLGAGIYTVKVTDQNNCNKQQTVTISSSNGPIITIDNTTTTTCSDTNDGSATISITQGQAPYTIQWPDNQTTTTATNLTGGDYIVEVRDNTGCLALKTVTVPSPQPLQIQTTTQQDPNCNGDANGSITVNAQGGNGTYTYNWNTGATTNTINSLTAGTYTVTTTDIKNCQATQQITLIDPVLFTIDLGADEKICEGQVITKQSNEANATYSWTGPNSFTSNQQQISTGQPGIYTLTVINQKGCEAQDSFEIIIDPDLLKADFLMVSEAFAGDTIIAIDISWPLPTTTTWTIDAGAVVLDQTQDIALLRFDNTGTYTITIEAQLAQCISSHSQNITIIDNPNGKIEGNTGEKDIIKTFSAYPNPATDAVRINIELNEMKGAVIEVYQLQTNRRELSKQLMNDLSYVTELRLDHLQPGLYVIVIKVGGELRSVKMMKL